MRSVVLKGHLLNVTRQVCIQYCFMNSSCAFTDERVQNQVWKACIESFELDISCIGNKLEDVLYKVPPVVEVYI